MFQRRVLPIFRNGRNVVAWTLEAPERGQQPNSFLPEDRNTENSSWEWFTYL